MNIFATDPCPRISAQNLDDKRIVKMVLETAQMLAAATLSHGVDIEYKKTHVNHPCTVWTRSGRQQFDWMIEHGLWLADEYAHRFGQPNHWYHKLVHHSSIIIIDKAAKHRGLFDEGRPLVFDFNSSGFHTSNGVHYNYQLCMSHKWCYKDARRPLWTKRVRPKFYGLINRVEKE